MSLPSDSLPEAIVAVLRRDNQLLVILRGPNASSAGHWSPPSGRIEPGERQDQTVVREMREELGIDVAPREKVWECLTDDGTFRLHWWTADVPNADFHPDPGEVAEARWVTGDEFLGLPDTFQGDRTFVTDVLPALQYPPRPTGAGRCGCGRTDCRGRTDA